MNIYFNSNSNSCCENKNNFLKYDLNNQKKATKSENQDFSECEKKENSSLNIN